MIRLWSKKMNQAGMVGLFSRIVQYQRVWDEPIAGSRLAAMHLLPGRMMFWNRTIGQVSCEWPVSSALRVIQSL